MYSLDREVTKSRRLLPVLPWIPAFLKALGVHAALTERVADIRRETSVVSVSP